MGWFGKGLGSKRTGEIALALLKKRMIKDGVCLTADEKETIFEKAQTMGLKTDKEIVDFAKKHMISKNFDNIPKVNGVNEEEMRAFVEKLAEELLELSFKSVKDNE